MISFSLLMKGRALLGSLILSTLLLGCGDDLPTEDSDHQQGPISTQQAIGEEGTASDEAHRLREPGLWASPEAQACGDLEHFGRCDGDSLQFCNQEMRPETVDCAMAGVDASTTCVFVDDHYGFDCGVRRGGTCHFVSGQGESRTGVVAFCEGEAAGCKLGPQGSACTENLGPCDEAVSPRTCRGEDLVIGCRESQPIVLDCSAYGGTCGEAAGACQGLALGALCDGDHLRCAPPYHCAPDPEDEERGRCTVEWTL